jgi:predicted house-cleaning NTP pyrophosphatase (Maf/HAM1 superfamily)
MPAPRACLIDIETLGLSHEVAHTSTGKDGHLVAHTSADVVVAAETTVATDKVVQEVAIVEQEVAVAQSQSDEVVEFVSEVVVEDTNKKGKNARARRSGFTNTPS